MLSIIKKLIVISLWGCSSVGRAPALQAGGQEFDSLHLHQVDLNRFAMQIEHKLIYEH